jgi:hypothetical protein
MAVQFLTGLNVNGNININTNQLQNAVIQPLATDPAGITGRIYYNSGTNKLKIYNGTDWVAFQTGTDGDTTYELFGVGSTNGTAGIQLDGSDGTLDNVLVVGAGSVLVTRAGNTLTVTGTDTALGTVTSVSQTHGGNAFTTGGSPITSSGTLAITMAGNSTQYVNGAGDLVLLSTIPQGDITEVQGGTYISVTNQTGPVPIVNHDATTRSDSTSTASPAHGATFTAVDSVTTNTTGHVTALNLKTVTLPADTNDNTTYTLPVSVGGSNSAVVTLDASTGTDSTLTISGTAGEIAITETVGNNGTVFIGLPDDVTVGRDLVVTRNLSVSGTSTFTGQLTIPLVPTADAHAASKRYVDQSNIGQSVFQGAYNAATNTPNLDTTSNIAVTRGFFYAVTVAGTFFTEAVQPGDLIYADVDQPANDAGNVASRWVVVQSGQDIATAGTQAAAIRGISAYDSTNFSVDASGFVTLNPQGNANGRRIDLQSSLAYVTRVVASGVTTFTVNIRNAALFGAAAEASRVKVEMTDRLAPFGTVYAEVTRSGSGTVIIAMNGTVLDDVYSLLLNYV